VLKVWAMKEPSTKLFVGQLVGIYELPGDLIGSARVMVIDDANEQIVVDEVTTNTKDIA